MIISKIDKPLVAILLSSFLASLIFSFYFRIHPVVDAQAYDQIAVNIVEGYGFKEDRSKSFQWDNAIVRAGPGYEYFLAGIYAVFGHRYEAVWVVQAIMHAASAFLIYLIAYRLFREEGRRIGLLAAGLFGFWPDLIEISAMLMTETLYLFFTIAVVYVFVRMYAVPTSRGGALLLGAMTGLAILTRPPLILFVPILLFFFWQKHTYRALGYFLFALGAALLPWVIRNYLIYHQVILTTMIGEFNLWVGNTLLADGGQLAGGYNPLKEYVDQFGYLDLKQKAKAEFFGFIAMHPLVFLKLCLLRVIRYLSLIRPMGFWFYQKGLGEAIMVGSSLVWIAGVFLTGFAGLISAWKTRQPLMRYVVLLAITAPLLLLPTVVQSRYRFQIYPFLALFGAFFAVSYMRKKQWWKGQEWVIAAGTLVSVSLIDILLNFQVITERISRFF